MYRLKSDLYQTVGICGSFRKHYKEICEAIKTFEEHGFKVLTPAVDKIKDESADFILFENNDTDNARELEKRHIDKLMESDIVYIVNCEGYLGASVMLELGYLLASKKEVIFLEEPKEQIIVQALIDNSQNGLGINFQSSLELSNEMISHNELVECRDWFDYRGPRDSNFKLESGKDLVRRI